MKIGFDVDGVLYPWHYSIHRYFKELKGYEGDESRFWKEKAKQISEEEWSYLVTIPILYEDTAPIYRTKEYLDMFSEKANLFYITSRPKELARITEKFLKKLDAPFKENLFIAEDKAPVVRLLSLDYYVDDQARHLERLKGITNVFLYTQPHNTDCREEYNCIRSLGEMYERIFNAKS